MPAKSARIIASLILLPPLLLLAACSGDDDEPARYAEPRAYTGVVVEQGEWHHGNVIFLRHFDPLGPAAAAGVENIDFLVRIDGQALASPQDFYALLESKRPGDSIQVEVDRPFEYWPPAPGLPPAERLHDPHLERMSFVIELGEEPLPGEVSFRTPYTSLRDEDQTRLGLYVGEITRPVAEYYGLDGPEGVYVVMVASPHFFREVHDLREGDVILEISGRRVNTLAQVQAAIDGLDEDRPIEVVVRRDGRNERHTLSPLGPDVPGANHFPADARQRLKAAIDRGDLHPSRIQLDFRRNFWRTDLGPGEPGMRMGAITSLSADSITIEIYSTGSEWTLELRQPLPRLRVGEFVQVFSDDGRRASRIYSLAQPLRRTPR